MKIREARVLPYILPLVETYLTATASRRTREGLLLRLVAEDGTEGWGEAAPLPGRTETLEEARSALSALAEALRDAEIPGPTLPGALALPATRPASAFAASLAAADLWSRHAGRPLAAHFAERVAPGRRAAVRVPVNALLPMCAPEETGRRAAELVGGGYRCLKLKVGTDAGQDGERLAAVRQAAGWQVALRLDANGAWDRRSAPERLRQAARIGVEYVEQPLAADDVEGLARLRESSPVPIAADESAGSPTAIRALLDRRAADVLVLKPMVLGRWEATTTAIRQAEEAGVSAVVTSALDGAVGRRGALLLAAARGAGRAACGLATGDLLAADVAEDVRPDRGMLPVPTGLGLGLRPDPSRIRSALPESDPPGSPAEGG